MCVYYCGNENHKSLNCTKDTKRVGQILKTVNSVITVLVRDIGRQNEDREILPTRVKASLYISVWRTTAKNSGSKRTKNEIIGKKGTEENLK